MKKLFTILSIAFPLLTFSQSENNDIFKGNEKYMQKDYLGAMQNYNDAILKNPASDATNYNLGNAFYQEKKIRRSGVKLSAGH